MGRLRSDANLFFMILLLVGLFLLNACGKSGTRSIPANLSNKDAVALQTGVYRGSNMNDKLRPTFEGNKVVYREPTKREFDSQELTVDFDTKQVSFTTDVNIDGVVRPLKLEGTFEEKTGIAIVRALDAKDNQPVGIGSVRCDNLCQQFYVEVYVKKVDSKGQVSYPEAQMQFDAEEVKTKGSAQSIFAPQLQSLPKNNERSDFSNVVDGVASTAQVVSQSQGSQKIEPKKDSKSTTQQNRQSSQGTPKSSIAIDLNDLTDEIPEGSEAAVFIHPTAITEKEKQDLKPISGQQLQMPALSPQKPSTATPTPRATTQPEGFAQTQKVDLNGIDTQVFPYTLGGRYLGQAQGCYAASLCNGVKTLSYLASSTEVIAGRKEGVKEGASLVSPESYSEYYFGSGLTVRHLEIASQRFQVQYPNEKIVVTAISQEVGGDRRCGFTLEDERAAKAKGIKCVHSSHRNGLDIDVSIPKTANGSIDYKKFSDLVKAFNADNVTDRFFLDEGITKKLCPYMKDPEGQRALKKIFFWPGHENHLHVREKCTMHNPFCFPVNYREKENNIRC